MKTNFKEIVKLEIKLQIEDINQKELDQLNRLKDKENKEVIQILYRLIITPTIEKYLKNKGIKNV